VTHSTRSMGHFNYRLVSSNSSKEHLRAALFPSRLVHSFIDTVAFMSDRIDGYFHSTPLSNLARPSSVTITEQQ
jgi:hypothetical protein